MQVPYQSLTLNASNEVAKSLLEQKYTLSNIRVPNAKLKKGQFEKREHSDESSGRLKGAKS